jgi:tetratricopeptide (TPR) repeat protein
MPRGQRTIRRRIVLVLVGAAVTAAAYGQTQPSPEAGARPKVYVATFDTNDTTKDKLDTFTQRLLQLRFQSIPEVEVAADGELPRCGPGAAGWANSSVQDIKPAANRGQTPAPVSSFYRVQGTLDLHSTRESSAQSNILVVYELVKITNCLATTIFRSTRTFGLPDALQNLEEAGDELGSQLSDDVAAKTAIRVETIEAQGDPNESYRASALLSKFVRQSVSNSDTLRLWDGTSRGQPGYTLQGTIRFSAAGKSKVTAKVEFSLNGASLPMASSERTITPTLEALVPFYLDASSLAVEGLLKSLSRQRADLSQIASDKPDALVHRAKQLLCLEKPDNQQVCSSDPQAALEAIAEAEKSAEGSNRAELMTLAGRAHFQSGDYTRAGEAFDSVLATSTYNFEARLGLLLEAGNAWYEAKQFSKAAERYRTCITTAKNDPSLSTQLRLQPEARRKLVDSLLLADKPVAALDELLDGLVAAHLPREANAEAKALYEGLSNEIDQVLKALPTNQLPSSEAKIESQLTFDAPIQASALAEIGRAYAREGKNINAVAAYRKSIELQPNNSVTFYYLGDALIADGRYREAVTVLRQATSLKTDYAPAYNDLGVALDASRHYDDAIAAYQSAIKYRPDYILALQNLARILVRKGSYPEAESIYKQLILLRPSDMIAYESLWYLYSTLSNADAADRTLQGMQRVAPDDPLTQSVIARAREDQEDFSGAARIYSSLYKQYPNQPYYLAGYFNEQIQAARRSGDFRLIQNTVKQLQKEVRERPGFDICFTLAWTYHTVRQVKDLDKAYQLYQQALEYRPDDLGILDNLTEIALERGDVQGLIAEATKILTLNGRDPNALENLGYGRFLAGDLYGAAEAYQEALKVAPDEALWNITYGEALLWMDEAEKAHQQFEIAREGLKKGARASSTWVWLMESKYDKSEKQRLIEYSTAAQKRALVEMLDGITYLRQNKVAPALERYRSGTGMLTNTDIGDVEVVRKAINDLRRLQGESPAQFDVNVGLGYLYDWLGETSKAAEFWEVYLKSGKDPVGLEEARRRAAARIP